MPHPTQKNPRRPERAGFPRATAAGRPYYLAMDARVAPSYSDRLWQLVEAQPPADGITPEAARELLRHMEMRHEAIYRAALGLDQRASVIGAAFLTVGAALVAGAAAATAAPVAPLLVAAAFFVVASALCFTAARPARMPMPGVHAAAWLTGEFLADPPAVRDVALAAQVTKEADLAAAMQERAARWFASALWVASLGPIAAGAALAVALLR